MNLFDGRLSRSFPSLNLSKANIGKKEMKPLVIYHSNCQDGFAAAWCFHHYSQLSKTEYEFLPGIYGEPIPITADLMNRTIYLVDFSYKRADVIKLLEAGALVILIDHHKSAIEDLAGLEKEYPAFAAFTSLTQSGATLAWDFLFNSFINADDKLSWKHSTDFGYTPRPFLLECIEDRDLWNFKIDGSKEICTGLFEEEYDFEIWDYWMSPIGAKSYQRQVALTLLERGKTLLRNQIKNIKSFIKTHAYEILFEDTWVPALNCPYMWASDAGNIMAANHPAGIALLWTESGTHITFSLRASAESSIDVAEIAQKYGGGGHKKAAGFRIPFDGELPFPCRRVSEVKFSEVLK